MANQNKPVHWSVWSRFGAALAVACCALGGPAAAQRVVGDRTEPSVIVDLSVLDELGPAPNLPQLLRPPAQPAAPYGRYGSAAPAPPATGGPVTVMPEPPGASDDERIVLKKPTGKTTARRTRPKPAPSAKRAPRPKPAPGEPPVAVTRPKPTPKPKPPPTVASPPTPPAPKVASPPPPAPAPTERMAAAPPSGGPAAPPPPPSVAELQAPAIKPAPAPVAPAPEPAAGPRSGSAVAALPPADSGVEGGKSVRVLFDAGSAKLTRGASRQLKSVAEAMNADNKLRLELLAYADGSSQSASRSRRLSLSRALAARSYLIGQGVRSTRIDVRALGNKTAGGPPDRIDVVVTSR